MRESNYKVLVQGTLKYTHKHIHSEIEMKEQPDEYVYIKLQIIIYFLIIIIN